MNKKQIQVLCVEKLRLQRKSYKTEQSYMGWINRYLDWLVAVQPSGDSAAKMEAYLTYLAKDCGVAASTQNQAFNALLFLYRHGLKVKLGEVRALRAKTPKHERHAPSVADITAMFEHLQNANGFPIRLLVKLLYGCGLRVSEPLGLRVKDVRMDRGQLIIRGAKGAQDRVVMLPPSLRPLLQLQIQSARLKWETDQADRVPVQLPNSYGRKCPSAAFAWGWAFVFPGHVPVKHPRTGEMVRYFLHESNIQRAVKKACSAAQLTMPFTPHHLRHAYATHTLDAGANIHDVKEVLGHKNVETTMVYLHAEIERVSSPLEVLAGVA